MRVGTIVKRVVTAAAVMAAVVTLQATPALAAGQLVPGPIPADEACSAHAGLGTYHLRACMGVLPGAPGIVAFAYVTLDAGHSPCQIRGRLIGPGDRDNGLYTLTCPAGAVSHWPLYVPVSALNGDFYAAFSIQRTVPNDRVGPQAVSPVARVSTAWQPPSQQTTTQVTIG
jgi:hypothetical protein